MKSIQGGDLSSNDLYFSSHGGPQFCMTSFITFGSYFCLTSRFPHGEVTSW
jgi:hypothetical protein